jgi:hypothetical protein
VDIETKRRELVEQHLLNTNPNDNPSQHAPFMVLRLWRVVTQVHMMFHIGINTVCLFYCFPAHYDCHRMSWWVQEFCVIDCCALGDNKREIIYNRINVGTVLSDICNKYITSLFFLIYITALIYKLYNFSFIFVINYKLSFSTKDGNASCLCRHFAELLILEYQHTQDSV